MFVGCASLGLSFAYAKRFITPLGIHPAASATYQMVLAALGLALFTDLHGITDITHSFSALLSTVFGLGLFCTGVAFVLYYVAVAGLGASTASTATYIRRPSPWRLGSSR